MLFQSIFTLLAVSGLVAAAPTTNNSTFSASGGGAPTIIIQNNCPATLTVGNAIASSWSGETVQVAAGSSHTYNFAAGWVGRIWGRSNCAGNDCNQAGMDSPASLAEFNFAGDSVFYDISLVDGFNIPMVVAPSEKINLPYGDSRLCATTSCSSLPSCPAGFEVLDDQGKVAGCMSACTKFKTDEYCCTGAYNSPDKCQATAYSQQVKAACPDAYSYAYDDATSAFMCTSKSYTVTFC